MKFFSITHKGLVRSNNEDHCYVRSFDNGAVLLSLADGMGGHAAGEKAAQIAVDTVHTFESGLGDPESQLARLVETAHGKVLEASLQEMSHRGMGTTLTAAFVNDGVVYWAHVGDSRLYLLRGTDLVQVTDDHTIPGLLLKEGEITRDMMMTHPLRNMLLRCVGCEKFEPDRGHFGVREGDLFLLSTDGLHDLVPEDAILSILCSDADLEGKLAALVRAALEAGGRDNITVVGAEA